MVRFLIARLLSSILLLLVVSFIIFSFIHLAPGSPESVLLGGHNVSQQEINSIRDEYHLNQPFLTQYGVWLGNVLQGNFGQSIASQAPVSEVIKPKILPTLELAAYAGLLILVFGFGAGVLAAVNRGTIFDTLISGVMLIGASVAQYVSGLLLIVVFADHLGWFPVFGLGSSSPGDRLYHLTLPAIALAALLCAFVGRITRASMIGALELEYVDTARSRGMKGRVVVLKHALRSALVPIVTVSALTTGYLITGAVIVEFTFGLNGLGGQLITSIQNKDFAVVQAIALIFTTVFILVNLLADLLYMAVDPRVRLRTSAA